MNVINNLISEEKLKFVTEFFQNIDPYFEFCILDKNLKLLYGKDDFVNKVDLAEEIQKKLGNKDFFLDTAFIFLLESDEEKLHFALYSYHPVLNEYAKKLIINFFTSENKLQQIKNSIQQSLNLVEVNKVKENLKKILKLIEDK